MKETGYLLQAALIVTWWLGLQFSSEFFAAFQYPGTDSTLFRAFLLPDLVIITLASVIRAYRPIVGLELFVLGAFAYATLFCVNASALTRGGLLPTGLMVIGLAYNCFLCFGPGIFRQAYAGRWMNAVKTLVQIGCFWTITLAVIPIILLNAFGELRWPPLDATTICGVTVFGLFGTLGLSSAFCFVTFGDGTPLPMDQTNRLVTLGPYRFVRNPMAVAGICQGLAVALICRSVPIAVYAALGGVAWHVVVRPVEERDLESRFGDPYREYRRQVCCWLPRLGRSGKTE